jgi:hypothetical protein
MNNTVFMESLKATNLEQPKDVKFGKLRTKKGH